MKYLISILVLSLSSFAFAGENCSIQSNEEQVQEQMEIKTDVPKFLVGAQVCVKLADGKETCVPAEKFKVVARKQQFIVTKTKQQDVVTCQVKGEKLRNRVSLLAGSGPKKGLDVYRTNNQVTIESQSGAVGGGQYQRVLPYFDDRLNIGLQLQSNDSVLGSVGIDF
jgi:hypothetical protein